MAVRTENQTSSDILTSRELHKLFSSTLPYVSHQDQVAGSTSRTCDSYFIIVAIIINDLYYDQNLIYQKLKKLITVSQHFRVNVTFQEYFVHKINGYLTDILLSDAGNLLMLASRLQAIINKPMLSSWCCGQ